LPSAHHGGYCRGLGADRTQRRAFGRLRLAQELLLQYDEGVRRPFWQRLSLWYGVYAAVWVGVYVVFW